MKKNCSRKGAKAQSLPDSRCGVLCVVLCVFASLRETFFVLGGGTLGP